ncbi:MAG: hypothetical protein ACREQL_10410 [Candidatus Binatia bacterium]
MEAASQTTLWSDRYDRSLEDILAVQDEISEHIAATLDQTFTSFSTKAIDPAVYDLYLHARPKSYAPEELRTNVGLLEVATQRAPNFAEAWGRLAYLRAWLRFYQPLLDRAASAGLVANEAERALALDPQNIDALLAQFFVIPPFGRFVEAHAVVGRIGRAPGLGAGGIYVGWHSRAIGRLRESAEATERAFLLDALNPMSANLVALSRMATGRVAEAVPVFEDLMARVPDMSFPVAGLLRAHAFLEDWAAVDRLLRRDTRCASFRTVWRSSGPSATPRRRTSAPSETRSQRIAPGRDASTSRGSCTQRTSGWSRKPTGRPRPPASVRVAPQTTSWGRTATAPGCCSTLECPNCATIRASCPCARASASSNSGWQPANGPTAWMTFPTTSRPNARRRARFRYTSSGFELTPRRHSDALTLVSVGEEYPRACTAGPAALCVRRSADAGILLTYGHMIAGNANAARAGLGPSVPRCCSL